MNEKNGMCSPSGLGRRKKMSDRQLYCRNVDQVSRYEGGKNGATEVYVSNYDSSRREGKMPDGSVMTGYDELLQSFDFNSAEEVRQIAQKKRLRRQTKPFKKRIFDVNRPSMNVVPDVNFDNLHYSDEVLSDSFSSNGLSEMDRSNVDNENEELLALGECTEIVDEEGYFDTLDVLEFEKLMMKNTDRNLIAALKNGEVYWEEEKDDETTMDKHLDDDGGTRTNKTSKIRNKGKRDSDIFDKLLNRIGHANDSTFHLLDKISDYSLNLDYIDCLESSELENPEQKHEEKYEECYLNHFEEESSAEKNLDEFHNNFCEIGEDPLLGQIWATSRVKGRDSLVKDLAKQEKFPEFFSLKANLISKWNLFYNNFIVNKISDENGNCDKLHSTTDKLLCMTDLQIKLYSLISNYVDIFYAGRTTENIIEIVSLYAIHIINHVLITKGRIKRHSDLILNHKKKRGDIITKIKMLEEQIVSGKVEDPKLIERLKEEKIKLFNLLDSLKEVEYRDQGFSRATVLVLLPMRNSAMFFFEIFRSLIPTSLAKCVKNKRKFYQLFYKRKFFHPGHSKEWNLTFQGLNNDSFCIGIRFTKKKLVMFSDLQSSDIILATPLNLRVMLENDVESRDYFSSIEILVVDQTDVIEMQNWDHIDFILKYINRIPSKTHDTDFSRVKMSLLNNQAIYYRQTLFFGSFQSVDTNGSFNRRCLNWAGKIKIKDSYHMGILESLNTSAKQTLYKLNVSHYTEIDEKRFEYFKNGIYGHIEEMSKNGGLMIFVPSYFDFVKIKDYLKKKNDFKTVFNSEYSAKSKIKKNFKLLSMKEAQTMVVTERFYFYHEKIFKSLKNVIFYSPPQHQNYYCQIVNWLPSNGCVLLIFTDYDFLEMERIVGREKAIAILNSSSKTFSLSLAT